MTSTNINPEALWNFPCEYSVKAFGKTCDELKPTVCKIVERHTDKIHPDKISSKQSSKGGYTAITLKIIATSRAQLDCIDQDLKKCRLIAYVL
ncbi:YbeD family protein [Candidatus Thioglobus sp.]|uniref:YbeD family protein n=1 Tax=Candidatus Thioglobus sp. TaxID=2026721 RepID=UPI003D0CC7E2